MIVDFQSILFRFELFFFYNSEFKIEIFVAFLFLAVREGVGLGRTV